MTSVPPASSDDTPDATPAGASAQGASAGPAPVKKPTTAKSTSARPAAAKKPRTVQAAAAKKAASGSQAKTTAAKAAATKTTTARTTAAKSAAATSASVSTAKATRPSAAKTTATSGATAAKKPAGAKKAPAKSVQSETAAKRATAATATSATATASAQSTTSAAKAAPKKPAATRPAAKRPQAARTAKIAAATTAPPAEVAEPSKSSIPAVPPIPDLDEPEFEPNSAAVPPVPEQSAEDAALALETLPDAPEQATGLESHHPSRLLWVSRWPFLKLVTVEEADAVAAARAERAEKARADAAAAKAAAIAAEIARIEALPPKDAAEIVTEFEVVALEPLTEPEPLTEVESADAATSLEENAVVPDADDAPAEVQAILEAEPVVEPKPIAEPAPDASAEPEPITEGLTLADELLLVEAAAVVGNRSFDELLAEEDTEGAAEPILKPSTVSPPTAPTRIIPGDAPVVLSISELSRRFGDTIAVDGIDLDVQQGSFYGIVGPNGAGKTTTLSMVTGLLRPDSGSITVHGIDVWANPATAKQTIGVLPDHLRVFDRLTGAQFLYYSGVLRGLDGVTVRSRVKDLANAFGLDDALNRLVADYSAGMTKKVALAASMIHSPRLLVLDEPFESVDPVSAANVIEILQKYVANGGTVVLSSHGMDLIQRVCDHVAIIVNGTVLASGAVDEVRGAGTLEDRFVELAGGRKAAEGMEWLHSFSD